MMLVSSVSTSHSLPEESLFSQYVVSRMLSGKSATTTLTPLDKKLEIEAVNKAFTRVNQITAIPDKIFPQVMSTCLNQKSRVIFPK